MEPSRLASDSSELQRSPDWHAMPVEEVTSRLQTGNSGLSAAEVGTRRQRYGRNVIRESEGPSSIALLLHQFRSPLIYILLVAAIATTVLQEYIDTGVIVAVLVLNAIIGFTQEKKAEESVQSLRQLVAPKAHVIRDGRELEIESAELVPGDLVLFESGTRVPADIRLVQTTTLRVDESLLTGESTQVWKSTDVVDAEAEVAERINMLFSGTTVTSGRGRGYVVATGASTQLGDIAEQIRGSDTGTTPLQERMDKFAKIVGIAVLVLIVVAFSVGLTVGFSASEMFLVGVGLAVSTVPEGLPIVFTVTLAIGVHRMAKQNAIIRRLPAVETLGSASVIGSDKTGTLTENRMSVQSIWTPDGSFEIDAADRNSGNSTYSSGLPSDINDVPALRMTLETGVLANEATLYQSDGDVVPHGDPTEVALLVVASHAGLDPEQIRIQCESKGEIPFEPDLKYAASLREVNGSVYQFVKGAPEQILEMSSSMSQGGESVALDRERIERAADEMARRGLRVLGTAAAEVDDYYQSGDRLATPRNLTFTGLFGLVDPPRQGVRDAIKGCQEAGIRVIMITGDHARTASAIAADLGISDHDDEVLAGRDLEQLTDEELEDAVRRVNVFARVSPEHKRRITEAWKRHGAIIGVTGDGVNDAPALKAAHIGIAMGKSGTDVAREASDMVLADDNFVSIYAAVEQGRVAFDNVRKVTFFLISADIALPMIVLAAIIIGWPIPFVPAQLLWLNLVTNGLQDVALAFEPGEPDTLQQKPRPLSEGIISPLLWERSALTAVVLTIGTMTMFWWELNRSDSLIQAQSVALTTMVVFQMFHVVNARSDYRSVFRVNPTSNPFLAVAMVGSFLIHVGALYFGPAQFVLRVEPISLLAWGYIVAMAFTVIAVVEVHKLLRPRRPE